MNSEESICCKEIAKMVQLLDEGDVRPECITEHQDFLPMQSRADCIFV